MLGTQGIRRSFTVAVPEGLQMRKFEYMKGRALVVALNRRSEEHCVFLSELLKIHRPKCVVTQLPVDHPWFIRSENTDIYSTWNNFIRTAQGSFLVNPRPSFMEEILLTREKIASFHTSAFLQTIKAFETSPHVAYTHHVLLKDKVGVGAKWKKMQVDAMLTPLLWMHNNREVANVAVIGGLPELVHRDQVVRQMNVHQMRDLFSKFLEVQWEEGGFFSLQQHAPELFLRPKAQYMTEIIRLSLMSFPSALTVVDSELLPLLEEEWKKLPTELRPFEQFFTIKTFPTPTPFVDHVEMHVLLDLMYSSFLSDWYLAYNVYPYSAFGTLGAAEAFYGQALTTWKYFYDQHIQTYKDSWITAPGGRKVPKTGSKKG